MTPSPHRALRSGGQVGPGTNHETVVIDALIEAEIAGLIDQGRWDADMADEARSKEVLQAISDRWDEVAAFVEDN